METGANIKKRKWPIVRTVLISVVILLVTAGVLVYNNFNRLLSDALNKSFNSSIVSDMYELKFENLLVNPFEGSIRVFNFSLQPREKPLHDYPYINSSFRVKTEKLTLKNVEIFTLLKLNTLILERISITKPDVTLTLAGKRHIMLPFADSTTLKSPEEEKKKRALDSYTLNEFQLIDASIQVFNSNKEREFTIRNFNISLNNLLLNQQPGEYQASVNDAAVSIGEFTGDMQKGVLQHVSFKDFKIGIDSLAIQFTLDTLTYRFHDFNTGLRDLDIHTADSLFHVSMQSFDLSYQDKSIKLKEISFKPNVKHAVLQKKYTFQHTEFSGTAGKLDILQVNFDSLIYAQKIFIDEIVLDNVKAFIFKDKTKPLDTTRMPVYLGQTVAAISLPVRIKHVKATHVQLENTERKPDSAYAKVNITRATLDVKNITNLSTETGLLMHADAYINGKAHFKAGLNFHYLKPQFTFDGVVEKFNLPDLNPLIQAYTPAKINKGISDEITFSGVGKKTAANGTLRFLYHDLEVDLQLKEKAKWVSSVIAFTANSVLNNSNPASSDLPAREVKFQIVRDMNKGFVNVLIKSILNGLKETMIMSKENKKAYKETKKTAKQDSKKKK
ncbi:MAG: DUF748 domain-containing protein [Bacteroidota bacterium]